MGTQIHARKGRNARAARSQTNVLTKPDLDSGRVASLSRHSRKHQQRKESYLRSFGNDPGLTFPREERRFCVGDLSWEATFWNTPLRWEVTPHTLCCVIPPLNSSAPLLHFWRGAGARMSVVEEFQPRVIIVWRWISKETKSSCCNGSLSETLADNCVSAR